MSPNRMSLRPAAAQPARDELESARRVCAYEQNRLAKLIRQLNASATTPADREVLAVCVETLGALLQAQLAIVDAALEDAAPNAARRAA